jgi:predicted TIM-barrel fold metal-dependent hydrolase
VFHTGIGDLDIRAKKNAGATLYNYSRQINDAIDIITLLIAGGVLDRHPDAHVMFAEYSAGWLWGLAERMDEVYQGHANAVSPKLSRWPSQIIRDQVHCAVQNDIGSISTREGVGIAPFLFATDYPHSEGTFPFSRDLVDSIPARHPDLTTDEYVAILGGNAAKLLERANLMPLVDARAKELANV